MLKYNLDQAKEASWSYCSTLGAKVLNTWSQRKLLGAKVLWGASNIINVVVVYFLPLPINSKQYVCLYS